MLSVAMLALGTRGDVQPLALLGWQIQHMHSQLKAQAFFITHAAHKAWLEEMLGCSSAMQFHYIDSYPAAVWQHSNSSRRQPAGNSSGLDPDASAASAITVTEAEARHQLLQHCCAALQCSWPRHQQQQQPAHSNPEQQQRQQQQPIQTLYVCNHKHCTPSAASVTEQQQQQQQQQQPVPTLCVCNHKQHTPPAASDLELQNSNHQRLIIFNLFALEGFHIAEALRVPCMVAQPYLIPYAMPSSFKSRFMKALPGLAQALQEGATTSGDAQQPCVSWADVCHWMWPLFTERWGSWRQEVLGLQPLPLVQAWQEGWEGCTYRCTDIASSGLASAALEAGHQQPPLPAAVPILYGLSPNVVTQPGYWPRSVHLTGFWLVSDLHNTPALQRQQQQADGQHSQRGPMQQQQQGPVSCCCILPHELQQCLESRTQYSKQQAQRQQRTDSTATVGANDSSYAGVLLVDFGSMGCLGLLRNADVLLHVVLRALQLLNWCGAVMTGGWQPLLAAYDQLTQHEKRQLFLQQESVACYHLLLSTVDVVLHHGGSGTTAAALAAGVPQLICPLQFDQFYWAERVAHLGCSPEPLSVDHLLPTLDDPAMPAQVATAAETGVSNDAAVPVAAARPAASVICGKPDDGLRDSDGVCVTAATYGKVTTAAAAGDKSEHNGALQDRDGVCVTAHQPAVKAAGAYLAAQIQAACVPDVMEACNAMKQDIAQETGLQTAAARVMQYCISLAGGANAT